MTMIYYLVLPPLSVPNFPRQTGTLINILLFGLSSIKHCSLPRLGSSGESLRDIDIGVGVVHFSIGLKQTNILGDSTFSFLYLSYFVTRLFFFYTFLILVLLSNE